MVQKELSGRALVWILLAAEEDYLCLLPRLSNDCDGGGEGRKLPSPPGIQAQCFADFFPTPRKNKKLPIQFKKW